MPKTISALCHTAHHIPTPPVLKYLNDAAEECLRQKVQVPTHCNPALCHIAHHIPSPPVLKYLNDVADECWRQNAQAPIHCNAVSYQIPHSNPTDCTIVKSFRNRNLTTPIGGIWIPWWPNCVNVCQLNGDSGLESGLSQQSGRSDGDQIPAYEVFLVKSS